MSDRLNELKSQVRINGFRPGKVPVSHIRKLYGRSIMAEVVSAGGQPIPARRRLRTAASARPISQRSRCLKTRAKWKRSWTAMATWPTLWRSKSYRRVRGLRVFKTLELTKKVAKVDDSHIDESLGGWPSRTARFQAARQNGQGEEGDRVTIDFRRPDRWGSLRRRAARRVRRLSLAVTVSSPVLRSRLSVPRPVMSSKVEVSFPDRSYGVEELAGKPAVFDVTVNEVAEPVELPRSMTTLPRA